ncbi:kynurenine formamidase [Prorops nasuta]|uniref:kynurenine formamidase n=1 Tax=Prorops nasuta TaxID=863751 RepID=UPI0034CDA31E
MESTSDNTISQHEIDLLPSRWSKRYNADKVVENFIELFQEVLNDVRSKTKYLLDVPYGDTNRTKMDIYGIDLPNDAPIFVYIHGGYWIELTKDSASFAVPVLVARGIKVICLGYDLCPNVKLADIVAQIKSGVERILADAVTSGSRCVWVGGHSAGAHLAATLIHDDVWLKRIASKGYDQLLKGIALFGGVYDISPLQTVSFNELLQLTEDEIKAYSLSKLDATNEMPIEGIKVILAVAGYEAPILKEQSVSYAMKLLTLVDHVEYIMLPKHDHFDLSEDLRKPDYILTRLLIQNILHL